MSSRRGPGDRQVRSRPRPQLSDWHGWVWGGGRHRRAVKHTSTLQRGLAGRVGKPTQRTVAPDTHLAHGHFERTMRDNFSSLSFPDAFPHESCPACPRDAPRALVGHLGAILVTGGGHGRPWTPSVSSKPQGRAEAQPPSQGEEPFREKGLTLCSRHLDLLSFLCRLRSHPHRRRLGRGVRDPHQGPCLLAVWACSSLSFPTCGMETVAHRAEKRG